jgi:hypothetical protein
LNDGIGDLGANAVAWNHGDGVRFHRA